MLEATNHLTVHGGINRHRSIFNSQRSTYERGVWTGLESSMLCLLKISMTYFVEIVTRRSSQKPQLHRSKIALQDPWWRI